MDQDGVAEALRVDRDRLLAAVAVRDRTGEEPELFHNPGRGTAMTLLDLVTHVAMWDEISLAVLAEARRGRAHWSLSPPWERVEVGRALNAGGVQAGRLLPPALVMDRFVSVRDTLALAIAEVPDREWHGELAFTHAGTQPQTLAGLCHYFNTPEADPDRRRAYQHASVHLGGTR